MVCLALTATTTCASEVEPCYFDARCALGNDPYGRLGCHAGGHTNCRFCGFGNYLEVPCPTGESGSKQMTIILAGTMETVGAKDTGKRAMWESSFKRDLAALMEIDKSRLTILDYRASSVIVELLVMAPAGNTQQSSDAAIAQLQSTITAAATSGTPPPSLGGMQIAVLDARSAPPAPPFDPRAHQVSSSFAVESSVSALSGSYGQGIDGGIVGAVAAGVVILLLVACVFRYLALIQQRNELAKAAIKKAANEASMPLPHTQKLDDVFVEYDTKEEVGGTGAAFKITQSGDLMSEGRSQELTTFRRVGAMSRRGGQSPFGKEFQSTFRGATMPDAMSLPVPMPKTHELPPPSYSSGITDPFSSRSGSDGLDDDQVPKSERSVSKPPPRAFVGLLCPLCKSASCDAAGLCPQCTAGVTFAPEITKIGLKFEEVAEEDRTHLWPDRYHVYVEKIMKGSVAYIEGIPTGMALCAINQTSCRGLTKDAVHELLKAAAGTERVLVFTPLARLAIPASQVVDEEGMAKRPVLSMPSARASVSMLSARRGAVISAAELVEEVIDDSEDAHEQIFMALPVGYGASVHRMPDSKSLHIPMSHDLPPPPMPGTHDLPPLPYSSGVIDPLPSALRSDSEGFDDDQVPKSERSVSKPPPRARGVVGENVALGETYTTRTKLKMRAEANMRSAPAGEMPANTHVHVLEWCTLPDGTRRAHVSEVSPSAERSGWLSCVAKDGRKTLVPTDTTDRDEEEYIFLALPEKQEAVGDSASPTMGLCASTASPTAPSPAPAAMPLTQRQQSGAKTKRHPRLAYPSRPAPAPTSKPASDHLIPGAGGDLEDRFSMSDPLAMPNKVVLTLSPRAPAPALGSARGEGKAQKERVRV